MKIVVGLIEYAGDIIACEPVARYLKNTYPGSRISWVVLPDYRELIDSNPNIDETITVDCLTEWMRLTRHGKFDQIVDLHVNYRVCQHCQIPLYKTTGNRDVTVYEWFDYGGILRAFSLGAGLPPLDDQPKLYVGEREQIAVGRFELGDNYCVVQTKSDDPAKDWRDGHWRDIVNYLIKSCGLRVVEVGARAPGKEDRDTSAPPSAWGDMLVDLKDKTSILETAEIVRHARLFVGVDSASAHMANASEVPGVVLLGRHGHVRRYNPFSGYYGDERRDVKLIRNLTGAVRDIPVVDVIEAIDYVSDVCGIARLPPERRRTAAGTGATAAQTAASPDRTASDTVVTAGDILPPTAPVANATAYPKLFAFYLPQFHPIQENNHAHGMGFSEWHHIVKAAPLFKGHYQPRVPGELGFYDLRSIDVMRQQIDLALAHGITGFCFYYYYFKGKKLLYKPIQNYIESDLTAPFCFLWANENWTKRWDGGNDELIIEQQHSIEDDTIFIQQLLPTFEDQRYLKIDNKPVLLVYKAHLFPNIRQTTEIWRSQAETAGFNGIYLVMADDWGPAFAHPRDLGFDASYEIPSNIIFDPTAFDQVTVAERAAFDFYGNFDGKLVDYHKFAKHHLSRPFPHYKRFRTVMLPWDNAPRYGNRAIIHVNTDNDAYHLWVAQACIDTFKRFSPDERIVFIHSWNEWCEGTYLEPDERHGRKFLEQTRDAVRAARQVIDDRGHIAGDSGALLAELDRAKEVGAFRTLQALRATIHDSRIDIDRLKHQLDSASQAADDRSRHLQENLARLQAIEEKSIRLQEDVVRLRLENELLKKEGKLKRELRKLEKRMRPFSRRLRDALAGLFGRSKQR